MTKGYVCDQGHKFLQAAKKLTRGMDPKDVAFISGLIEVAPADEALKPLVDIFKKLIDNLDFTTLEKSVCPFCQSLTFMEAPEEDIVGVMSVDLDKVNATLQNNPGYKVENLYQKTATLVKRGIHDEVKIA